MQPGSPDSTQGSILAVCDRIRSLTHQDIQARWVCHMGDLPQTQATDPTQWQTWKPITLNERQHIAWPQGQQVIWLGQVFTLPVALQDYPLANTIVRLSLVWWAEQTDIYVQGQLAQVGDLYDCFARVILSECAQPGHPIAVALRLVSPGHDPGALVQSQLIFEPTDSHQLDPGMIADELEGLAYVLQAEQPEQCAQLNAAANALDWTVCQDNALFQASLRQLRDQLQPFQAQLKQRHIGWVGHAHLDMAWLWPVAETWDVAERTFKSVLQLQAEFPELIFCHSSPALYAWLETHRPELFTQIQAQVTAGRWEIAAGLWIEPELNLISGESLVRQVFYGQRYTQAKFGVQSVTAWLPDSFGFCWQLPQILKQGEIDYFVTQKLQWNDSTQFPHQVFWWQAPDGTDILAIMLPPIGKGIHPVEMAKHAQDWKTATGCPTSLWLPGVGDHGGGPTRDMLELARQWQQSPLFPQLQPMPAAAVCRQIEAEATEIPVWNNELYLEYHRGCYTSHADQKRFNRTCETLLVEAEIMSAIATLTLARRYPHAELEQAWKQVLFNQFHDILPGSAIPEVFADANRDWQAAQQTATDCLDGALSAIANAIQLPLPPVAGALPLVVFNGFNGVRSQLMRCNLPPGHWQILDHQGQTIITQPGFTKQEWLFWASDVPGVGYRTYWATPTTPSTAPAPPPQDWTLENDALRVEIQPETGEIQRIYDKHEGREVLSGPGNHLQFFTDRGQYWDAWNIDPDYAQHPLPNAVLESIEWISWGALEQRIRVTLHQDRSVFRQDYCLIEHTPYLKIETEVDWQTRQVLVKAAFPLTVKAEKATYEIPCGAIERPTLPNPQPLADREKAKWEVPALQWADLTEQTAHSAYGVSLLNDCKHGYDAQPNQLRLTLLRSPNWPDPSCDRGSHQFTYSLYPHTGTWQTAHTPRVATDLNRPLHIIFPNVPTPLTASLPAVHQFLDLPDTVQLMTLKQSEDDPHQWVLRCHEGYGQSSDFSITNTLGLQIDSTLNGLEHTLNPQAPTTISPWEIMTCSLQTKRD